MKEGTGYIAHPGGRTWYRVLGSAHPKTPLLLLHGGPGSTHNYFEPLARTISATRPVVIYDQVGCGGSPKKDREPWSLALFTHELEALRSGLGLEEVHLLGTSWGGMLALEHALGGAGGIASLVLSSTLSSMSLWVEEVAALRDRMPEVVARTLRTADDPDDPGYLEAEAAFNRRHFYRGPLPQPDIQRMMRDRGVAAYRGMWGPNEWTPSGALGRWERTDRLIEIAAPTLVVSGRHDLCTPLVAEVLVRGIAGAEQVIFEGSSHTPLSRGGRPLRGGRERLPGAGRAG